MVVAASFYILLITCLNLIAQSAGSALAFPGEDVMSFSDSEIKARELGSKIDLLAEVGMLNVIWVLKTCMLIFYHRLTYGPFDAVCPTSTFANERPDKAFLVVSLLSRSWPSMLPWDG